MQKILMAVMLFFLTASYAGVCGLRVQSMVFTPGPAEVVSEPVYAQIWASCHGFGRQSQIPVVITVSQLDGYLKSAHDRIPLKLCYDASCQTTLGGNERMILHGVLLNDQTQSFIVWAKLDVDQKTHPGSYQGSLNVVLDY